MCNSSAVGWELKVQCILGRNDRVGGEVVLSLEPRHHSIYEGVVTAIAWQRCSCYRERVLLETRKQIHTLCTYLRFGVGLATVENGVRTSCARCTIVLRGTCDDAAVECSVHFATVAQCTRGDAVLAGNM